MATDEHVFTSAPDTRQTSSAGCDVLLPDLDDEPASEPVRKPPASPPPASGPSQQTPLLPHHRDHLRASGLSDATIQAAGIRSVLDPREAANDLIWAADGPVPAIKFPYLGFDGTVLYHVLRPDCPVVRDDGTAPKYESPTETPPWMYYPPAALVARELYTRADRPLAFVEGIKKVLKVAQTDPTLPMISAQGVSVWHDIGHKKETKEWRLHPDVAQLVLPGRRVELFFDGGDTTENPPVIQSEARLARMILDAGGDPWLVRIPFAPGKKCGIDDYLAIQDDPAAALQRIRADAIPGDPVVRARAVAEAEDPAAAALALMNDQSFVAALHVAPIVVADIVAKLLRGRTGITKSAISDARKRFAKRLSGAEAAHGGVAATARAAKEIDPKVAQEASSLLRRADLLTYFEQVLAKLGLVGERTAATILLLAVVLRRSKRALHVVVKAASASGKNYVVDRVTGLLPPEDVVMISDMSPHALNYLGDGLKNKVVVIVETVGAERAEYPLRLLMSEGRLVTRVAEKVDDEQGSRIATREYSVEGPLCVIMTTTRGLLHGENESRVIEVNLDESADQTERILEAQARAAAEPPSAEEQCAVDHERSVWRAALAALHPRDVVIHQAIRLAPNFMRRRVRARRDFPKLLALIEAHALLHQYQRALDADGRTIAYDEDVHAGLRLSGMLADEIPARLRGYADRLRDAYGQSDFRPVDVANVLGVAPDSARRILRELESVGLVEPAGESHGRVPSLWRMDPTSVGASPTR